MGFGSTTVLAAEPSSAPSTIRIRKTKPVDPTSAAKEIDRGLDTEFQSAAPVKEELTDDYAFLRRVYFDTVGRPPSVTQIEAFVESEPEDKRGKMIRELLARPEYGENWAGYWRDVVMYRRSEDRALLAARTLQDYLAQAFNENRSWDRVAGDFVTAEGDVRESGATALIMAQAGRPEETVGELSRIFLGIQIQCAQCHDHPTDSWTREQFHQLAAFFPRVALRPVRDGDRRSFAVVGVDRLRAPKIKDVNGRYVPRPEHYMADLEDPTAEGKLTKPVFFVNGKDVPLGTTDADRREVLAQWMTADENPWFAIAVINRLWTELTGQGFYEHIDDLGPERECRAHATLDYLANQFVAHHFDLKWLFETILRTDAYQRGSRSHIEGTAVDLRQPRPRRLRSDQIFQSLVTTLGLPTSRREVSSDPEGPAARFRRDPRFLFSTVFGFDPSDPREEITGSVPQSLLLMNSPLLQAPISRPIRLGGLDQWVAKAETNSQRVRTLYLRFLARPASEDELKTALEFVRKADDDHQGIEDLVWCLMNSAEFAYVF